MYSQVETMRNNRNAGHNYERDLVNEMKKWFPDCMTSRYASRLLDDQKVDLYGTGLYNIQAKYTKSMSINKAQEILQEMPKEGWNVIIHKLNTWVGKKKTETVLMDKETFYEIVDYIANQ